MSCVSKEKEVSPIIAKCHDTIAAAMHAIDPAKVNETTDMALKITVSLQGDHGGRAPWLS